MSKILPFALAPLLVAGCLSSGPRPAVNWTVESLPVTAAAAPKWGVVRVAQVNVRAPYDGVRFAVLRPDGSIAFDAYNAFAASPAAILRGTACDIMAASGLFTRVLPSSSAAAADVSVEITVERLAVDCRVKGARHAVVSLAVRLLKGREVVSSATGEGSLPAAAGGYTAAFSSAFNRALSEALKRLQDDGASAPDRQKRR